MDLDRAREILIAHSRKPSHPHESSRPGEIVGECRNPLCGDYVRVFVSLKNEQIADCTIDVQGCTMCVASASLMSEDVRGLTAAECISRGRRFADAIMGSESPWPKELSRLEAFEHLRVNRARIPCTLISWHALKNALESPRLCD